MTWKICQKCGARFSTESQFCSYCGNPLVLVVGSPEGPAAQQENQVMQNPSIPSYPTQEQGWNPDFQPFTPPQQPVYVNNSPEKSSAAIALGIIAIIFAFFFPLVSYGCGIPGVIFAAKGKKTGASNATAGIVLNVIGLSLAVLGSIVGVFMNWLIFFPKI